MENPERLFMCRLALALGKSLPEIASMSSDEFITWLAYYQLEPFGCPADDSRTEAQMALFFSANSKQGTPVPQFINRWPKQERSEEPKPVANLHNKIKGFFEAYMERGNKPKSGQSKDDQ